MIRSYASRLDEITVPEGATCPAHQRPPDARTLAYSLDTEPSALWFFVLHAHTLYRRCEIPKKSGGRRALHIPDPRLALLQEKILHRYLHAVDYPPWVSAYVQGRNTQDAAAQHAGRPVLIVLDLKDFFPSTKRRWVTDMFETHFQLSRTAAELLGTLTTAPWQPGEKRYFVVPQGAPTSGAVANLVAMQRLDPLICEICARHGMTYTRYADDLAFSSPKDPGKEGTRRFIQEIIGAVKQAGYRVNYDKIRVQRRNRQQRLLGLTINERPNMPKPDFRRMRALVHSCATKGYDRTAAERGYRSAEALEQYVSGMLAYMTMVAPAKAAQLRARLAGGGGLDATPPGP